MSQEYFQQKVDHEIHVRLDDVNHTLHASETITYTNNSPSTLGFIWFHLWPNAYRDANSALSRQLLRSDDRSLYYAKYEDRGWIDSLNFTVNGQQATWEPHPDHADICKLNLPAPLAPGASITIATPFRVKVPSADFSRLGHTGQAYYVTQWFPKPAVFDAQGWHEMPYLTQGEFYSEFGKYDVFITVPDNYVVGATGNLIDGEKELAWMDEKAMATLAKDPEAKDDMSFPPSSVTTKTLHYQLDRIHDFAWFADKRYNVLKGSVKVPGTGSEIITWALFTDNDGKLWRKGPEYLADAIEHYSKHVGPYPFKVVTAVDGVLAAGGGMEYPTITIIGNTGSAMSLDEVILHEVGHNWFYGILASNERDHPWMDEGMNSWLESRYMRKKYPQAGLSEFIGRRGVMKTASKMLGVNHLKYAQTPQLGYQMSARMNMDQPLEGVSQDFMRVNYGTIVYMKTAAIFTYLEAYLGEAAVDSFLRTYYRQWAFKHPQPADLKQSLYEATGRHFPWLTEGLIESFDKMDHSIYDVKEGENGQAKVRLRNLGGINGPVPLAGMKGDSVVILKWIEPFEKTTEVTVDCPTCDRFALDPQQLTPDINRKNDQFRRRGALRNVERLDPRLFGYFERGDRSRFAFAPVIGGNRYDGAMVGLAFYNSLIPVNKFDYFIMPMFATNSLTLTGQFNMGCTIHNKEQFPDVRIGLAAQRYDVGTYFYKPNTVFRPEIRFDFRPDRRDQPIQHSIRLRDNIFINEKANFSVAENILQVDYNYTNGIASFPHEVKAGFQAMNHARFTVEATGFLPYRKGKRNGMGIRLFGGKNFGNTNNQYLFRMSGWRGPQDYLYDGAYLGRFESTGFFAQQMMVADGGFRTYTVVGQSADWLVALNLTSTVYRNVPIVFFASVGTYGSQGIITGSEMFLFELGATVRVVPDVLEVHFPFYTTDNITRNTDLISPNYWQRIRFSFNIQNLSLRKTIKGMFD